jgi:hypothetical protein
VHNGFIEANNLKMQGNFKNIEVWTERKKMKLNTKKSCGMVFNFTKNY